MANLFDSANAPEGEPTTVVVGDFIQWKRSDLVNDYPPAEYNASYTARITGGGASEIFLAADETDPSTYLFTVSSLESATFVAGVYHWQLEITKQATGDRIVVDTGDFTALPDLDDNQTDPRTHAEKMLAKIETILEGKADSDVASYSINGRSLTKIPVSELLQWRDYYAREVAKHKAATLAKKGKVAAKTVLVRF